jgi:hypothetical protein
MSKDKKSLKGPPHEPASDDPPGEGGRFKALEEKLEKKGSLIRALVKAAKDSCPGSKIRSKGKGRGKGYGKTKGPIGTPVKEKEEKDDDEVKLAEAVRDPAALAAWIGRKKYGKKKYQEMAAAGRKKKAQAEPSVGRWGGAARGAAIGGGLGAAAGMVPGVALGALYYILRKVLGKKADLTKSVGGGALIGAGAGGLAGAVPFGLAGYGVGRAMESGPDIAAGVKNALGNMQTRGFNGQAGPPAVRPGM